VLFGLGLDSHRKLGGVPPMGLEPIL